MFIFFILLFGALVYTAPQMTFYLLTAPFFAILFGTFVWACAGLLGADVFRSSAYGTFIVVSYIGVVVHGNK